MNILEIDIQESIPDIVDAYAEVYGEEYRDVIKKRINSIKYVMYSNVDGVSAYYRFLIECKKRELGLKFLEQIGIDVSKCREKSYAEDLDNYTNDLLTQYIGGIHYGINPEAKNDPFGIKAFGEHKENEKLADIVEAQVEFLNFLRGSEVERITAETFNVFKKADEYNLLFNKIQSWLKLFDQLLKEYDEHIKSIEPYKKFLDYEKERKKSIFDYKRSDIYESLEGCIPFDIKTVLNSNCSGSDEKSDMLFGGSIDKKFYIEYFSKEDDEKINDPSFEASEKIWLFYFRLQYFKSLGIEVDPWKEMHTYKELIKREDIKKLIPSIEFVKQVTKCREEKFEEAQKEFVCYSQEFLRKASMFCNTPSNKEAVYSRIKNNCICVTCVTFNNTEFLPIIFHTVRSGDGGILDYIFLHEICHSIESTKGLFKMQETGYKCGFDLNAEVVSSNPYNPEKRKYERLNETIVDIFAIEARNILHKKGIYFIEPKEIIVHDVKNFNTASITKNMITPLLTRYRSQVIKARLFGNMEEFYESVGFDNFEALNDAINKVDYMLNQGLLEALRYNNSEDPLIIEYNYQLDRVEQIYASMDCKKY